MNTRRLTFNLTAGLPMQTTWPAPTTTFTPSTFISALSGGISSIQSSWRADASSALSTSTKASIAAWSSRPRTLVRAVVATAVKVVATDAIGSAGTAVCISAAIGLRLHPRHACSEGLGGCRCGR